MADSKKTKVTILTLAVETCDDGDIRHALDYMYKAAVEKMPPANTINDPTKYRTIHSTDGFVGSLNELLQP